MCAGSRRDRQRNVANRPGHVPVHYKPLVTPKRIMVDTGACCHHREAEPDKPVYLHFGKLSCVDVLSGQFWQSSRWPYNPAG